MTKLPVVDFAAEPLSVSTRRLADLPDRVTEGDPHHETVMQLESPDKKMIAGTWTSTPGKWRAFIDRDEFCYIISGNVNLISEDGTVQNFPAGSSFLIPNGFRGYWEVLETTVKHFVIRLHD